MRRVDAMQESLFTVARLDDFVPEDHPLRAVRVLVNAALAETNPRFNEIYAPSGRDSIAPEKLIRALLFDCDRPSRDRLSNWLPVPAATFSRRRPPSFSEHSSTAC